MSNPHFEIRPLPHGEYLKFLICARRKREDTQERYFYEWGNIHVSLMLTTPAVLQVFKRYIQHYAISGVTDDMLLYPLSAMEWDNMADHWLVSNEDLLISLTDIGYVQRMQPHSFGDKNFNLALCTGEVVFQKAGFRSGGGVKLTHWFKKRPELSIEAFNRHWRDRYAPVFLETAGGAGLVRKYVQNRQLELDRVMFKGTLFEHGGVGEFAGVEEIWFDSLESLARLKRDASLRGPLETALAEFVDPEGSFSMVTTERVVFDYATPGELSPPPAIRDPGSLETQVVAQGYRDWNLPKPVMDTPVG
ncbi:MAG TPA: EthD domain-containing protein [Caulobacteraceae bacterium]